MAKKIKKTLVAIVIGSDSDLPIMKNTANTLERFKVGYELIISSAHRSPKRTKEGTPHSRRMPCSLLAINDRPSTGFEGRM